MNLAMGNDWTITVVGLEECLNHLRSYAQKIASIDLSVLIQMFSAIGRIVFLKSNIETNVFLDK